MRLAYLILAHDKPQQLARLFKALPADSPIFIHFDAWAKPENWQQLTEILPAHPNVHLVRRHGCRWGSFGIVAGTLELIRGLVRSGADFDYAALISGADYPVQSNGAIAERLEQGHGTEYMESFLLDEPNRWDGNKGRYAAKNRYNYYYFWIRSRNFKLFKRKRPPLNMKLHGGSQWWVLSNAAINHIYDFTNRNKSYLSYYKRTLIPDESFFQTIMSNSPYRDRISGHDLTFAIWNRPEPPFPAILASTDIPEMKASGKLFARKFDLRKSQDAFDEIDVQLRQQS